MANPRLLLLSLGLYGLSVCCSLPSWAQFEPLPGRGIDPLEPERPVPDTPPELPENPEDLLPTPAVEPGQTLPPNTEEITLSVTAVEFEGNTLFDTATLEATVAEIVENPGPPWRPQTLTLNQLVSLAEAVARLYREAGYSTAGALVQVPEATQASGSGLIRIAVTEGSVTAVNIAGTERLNSGYVRSRLGVTDDQPLNVLQLQERLQLLQLDPLIQQIQASLNAGAESGSSILDVTVEETESASISLGLNNNRPASVGTGQRQVFFSDANFLGIGDAINVGISNTDGSTSWSFSYSVPLGPSDSTISFSFSPGINDIIDETFFDLNRDDIGPDIQSRSQSYDLTFRQPLVRSVQGETFQELAVGVTGSLRNSQSFLLGESFPLSTGASSDGIVRIAALRFSQEYTRRDGRQVLALRSQFNVGLDALGSTINESVAGVEAIPDSRFLSWLGQVQWVRVLDTDSLLILKANAQFADRGLLSAEQFGIGGGSSVRGYRQDRLLTDNGVFASAEARFPVLRVPELQSTLLIAPFVDFGTGWNDNPADNPDPRTLLSVGFGLQLQQADNLTARLDWGIPLINGSADGSNWQENGLYFSVVYTPF